MSEGASTTRMSETKDVAAVSRSEPLKQAEVRGESSRSVPVVAFEEWRTETEGSQSVAKEHTRKKEEPLMGNTKGYSAQESVNVRSADSASDEARWRKPSRPSECLHRKNRMP